MGQFSICHWACIQYSFFQSFDLINFEIKSNKIWVVWFANLLCEICVKQITKFDTKNWKKNIYNWIFSLSSTVSAYFDCIKIPELIYKFKCNHRIGLFESRLCVCVCVCRWMWSIVPIVCKLLWCWQTKLSFTRVWIWCIPTNVYIWI